MPTRLPSMAALRAFESAARHLSFTRASIELNLTQSAVSHQIRLLEEMLGVQLFVRTAGEIRLTDAAHDYLEAVRASLKLIQSGTDRVAGRRDDVLVIGSLGAFAVKCLLPHLGDFTRLYPDEVLSIRTLYPFTRGAADDFDVSIQFGREGDWPGYLSMRVTSEEIFPVCSPRLVEGENGLRHPKDLAAYPIVRTISPLILRDDWPFWLRKAGVAHIELPKEITCDLFTPALQMAIEGLAVVMGRDPLVNGDILAGRLVEPFRIRISSPLGYHAVYRSELEGAPKVQRFLAWATTNLAQRLAPLRHANPAIDMAG